MSDMETGSDETAPAAVRLAGLARDLFASMPAAKPFVAAWPTDGTLRPVEPASLPVLAWLDACVGQGTPATTALLTTLVAFAPQLAWWQTYGADDFGPAFLERYGWLELIGLRGAIPSERIACGVLMLGPDTDYPSHAHEAEEIYVPLAGSALWQKGGADYVTQPAGSLIHHPSWMPHAMRTVSDPLLALYVWRGGDLAAKPAIVDAR